MGCCVSSNRATSSASSPRKQNQDTVVGAQAPRSSISRVKASESRAPPQVEEETVKEVLSETPKWKPTIAKLEAEKAPQKPAIDMHERESKVKKAMAINNAEEISEVSEVCSLSESMSTTTTTITEKREEDEEIRKRVNRSPAKMHKDRSFSGDFGGKRERTVVAKSPARWSEQSPGRRNVGSARFVQSRDQLGHAMANGGTRNQPRRRDAGDNSGRRSMSPATRTENGATRSVVGRSPSARRTNQSPSRVRTDPPESGCRKMENPNVEGKWPSANESLENPLVSLECFIFL